MDYLKNPIRCVYRPIQRNKLQFFISMTLAVVVALTLSFSIGESYDWSNQRLRGQPRRVKRQTTQSSDSYKDPFPNRPRIQTKNGHLIIEASQDKNIDFKTSGSRGSITINGIKVDQLLNVSKAIEKTFQQVGSKNSKQTKSGDPYEMIIENIYLSDSKILALQRSVDELGSFLGDINKKLRKNSKEVAKLMQQTSKLGKQQDNFLTKLKRNDCMNNETGQPVCKNGATCIDTYDGFRCLCPTNFEGPTCEQDVDECAKFRNTDLGCQNGAKCVNLLGSYRCECTPQYHGVHCTEQHEDCSLSSSRSLCGFGKCINLARTMPNQANYECLCDQGWTTDGKNPACIVDINECLVGTSGSNTSMDSSVPWSNSLMAAYPCSQNPYVECANLPGSFQCGPCPLGYTGNGRVCRDIDECATNNGGCSTSPPVECINTQGSRRCGPCPPGYAGYGATCTPTTACSLIPNGGCHPMAKCLDLKGATSNERLCYCQFPYEGDGVGLNGCKLSAGAANFTNINATLASISPAFKQDDCQPNPCLNGGECLLSEASYECVCPLGKSGKRCEVANIKCGGDFLSGRGQLKFPYPGTFNDVLFRPSKNEMKAVDQHYDCYWRVSVASNMSVKILFNELSNKVNPPKKIQMYLANSTDGPLPTCTESLDVRERLDADPFSDNPASALNYRLVARFCPDARGTKLTSVNPTIKKSLPLIVESNTVELEYTFSETRTQFGEPSLAFDMNWTSIEPPCGGELEVAGSGSISSPKFPEFYQAGIECRYLIRVPFGHRVRLQFGELNLLTGRPHSSSCSDSLTIIDGAIGPERPVLFKHCANNSTTMTKSQSLAPIISSSSAVEVILISRPGSSIPLMRPKEKRGFYLTYSSDSTLPGCGGLFTQKSTTIRSVDYEPSPIDPNQRENSMLALQISRYFEPKDGGGSVYPPQDPAISSMYDFVIRDEAIYSGGSNSSAAPPNRRSKWYKTRCEYEIRPANQARDHKIAIDWLDMPGEPITQTNALSTWSRRLRCNAARLTIYDGSSIDGTNRTEIARFCSGDRYNSSSPLLMPVTSSGHVLLLVYESRLALDEGPSGSDLPSGSVGSGFKLHYSTVCVATYEQLAGEIQVDVNMDVPECIYHIMLPANNSISLVVIPTSVDSLIRQDGACPAQAVFMDGAVQNSRLALVGVERQLRSFKFEKLIGTGSASNLSSRAGDGFNESMSVVVKDEPDGGSQTEMASDSYWQYTWSPAHDIKEFEVCKLPFLNFDSIWNHLSLMFRANPRMFETNQTLSPSAQPKMSDSLKMSVRYQAEPACGGIVSEPREGNFIIESVRGITSVASYPLTATRYDAFVMQHFTNTCAWILRARPNQVVNLEFDAPTNEINKRYKEWLSWRKSRNLPTSHFNCSLVFQESIELYEPSLNRTRHLCLTDLFSNNATNKWITQSNIVYLRMRNETEAVMNNSGSNDRIWPSRRPLLSGNLMITAKYQFISLTNRTVCGGNLLHDSGVLTSPRFPFNYPPNMNCTWVIKTNPGQQIRMNFTRFDIEKQADCLFDYLEMRNGPSDQSPLIGRFCNQDLQNRTIVAHSSSIWITFKSDSHLSRPGFEMRYDGALSGCGGKLATPSGQIDSPNYPQPFAHNGSCEWTIELSKSNNVELYILDLDLSENSTFCQPDGPKTDYLEIFDVAADNSTRSFGKMCTLKEVKERSLRSTNNKLTIVYRSQVLDNSRGFRLTYRTLCSGPIELSGSQGVIESPGYPLDYMPHLKCDWLIRGPTGTNLTLNITDLDIEESVEGDLLIKRPPIKPSCSADFLEIWARNAPFVNLAAPQANSTAIEKGTQLVQSICGTINRWTNSSQSNLLINLNTSVANVKFESDRSVETKGFRLEWRSRS